MLRHDVAELIAPLPSFRRGRTAPPGEAAHPVTPNLGQGACQALQDVAVIARMADGTEPDAVIGMLARYTAVRLPRPPTSSAGPPCHHHDNPGLASCRSLPQRDHTADRQARTASRAPHPSPPFTTGSPLRRPRPAETA
jgi:hypothetical protein